MRTMKQTTRPRPATRTALLTALVMAVVVLFTAAGCASIPTRGPVGKSDPVGPRNNSVNVDYQRFKPVAGASPESIIRGFIDSGTGFIDDFQVAREYLTPGLAQSWAADKRTLVYKNAFSVTAGPEKDSYQVKFDVVATVDSTGVLTPEPASRTETIDMKLVLVDGEWRIAENPDGVILLESIFQTLFTPVSLYFYDPTFTYGVPDVRWLAGRTSRTTTAIVKAMLAGPAPYLNGAVRSAFPNGISLVRESVPVTSGLAKVGLTSALLLETNVKQRQQMHAQLLVTLQKNLNTVSEVQFLADDREVDMGNAADAVPAMVIDNPAPPVQVALSKNDLVTYDGTKTAPIPGLRSVADLAPKAPAISYSGKSFAFLDGAGRNLYVATPGTPETIAASGPALTPPSFAPNGWLWTATGDGSGTVLAVDTNNAGHTPDPVVMSVPWLVGQHVKTLRISRDGTRALVISESNGVTRTQITGIFKTGETPKELTTPISLIQTGSPTLGVWVSESSVAVMAPSAAGPVTIEILDLAKPAVELTDLEGAQWLTAGAGARNIHAQTATEYFSYVGNSWEPTAKSLHSASFAG